MDASVALMNQYTMISAQFPPLQTVPTPSSTANVSETQKATTSNDVDSQKSNIEEKKQSTSSNIDEAGPSTSNKTNSIETLEIDGNVVTIEDIGRNDPTDDPNDPICEVRRRRLQRFELKSQDS